MASISEFSERLYQDIASNADAYGTYQGEAFFQAISEYVQESGDLEEAIQVELTIFAAHG